MMELYYNILGCLLLARASVSTTVDGRECPSIPPKLSRDRPICPGSFGGITSVQCMGLREDCCFDNSTRNVAWCYKPAMHQTQFKLEERLQTFVIETALKQDVRKTFTQAKLRCENDFQGSLAMIKSQQDLDIIDSKVTSINVSAPLVDGVYELWVAGRTDRDMHSLLDLSNDDVKISGQNCIILSNYSHPNTTRNFNLYSKRCTDNTRWGSICAVDTIVTKQFSGNSQNYILKLGKRSSRINSLSECSGTYNGTSLGKILNDDDLATVNNELLQTTNLSFTVWVDGKTDKSGPLDYADVKDIGSNCVVLKQANESSYALYSESCSEESNKAFLCEQSIVQPSKYIFGESEGKCRANTKITTSSVLIHKDECTDLGGKIVSSPTSEQMVKCQLDWCGTNTTADITGIVAAVPGYCPGSSAAKGMIENIELCKRFYRGLTNKSVINNFKKSCSIEWCKKTKAGQWYSFTFSTDMCEVTHSLPAPSLDMYNINCDQLGGKRADNPGQKQQCQMNFCHLGNNKECKSTSTGKEYKGTLSTTISGKQCQRWDSSFPHNHANKDPKMFPDNTIADASNYCRNPVGLIEGPFCYTTDAAVEWELCDIQFCPGDGPIVKDYQIGLNRYIFVPGKHKDPWGFCQKLYGAGGAIIEKESEAKELSKWLNELRSNNVSGEVSIGGRAPASFRKGQEITDLQTIVKDGSTGHCLVLSNWNSKTYKYDSNTYKVYASDCPEFFDQFICEVTEYEIKNYQVDGGIPQMEVHDVRTCKLKCTGDCTAIGYNTYEDSCWHYFNNVDCKPGRQTWGYNFIVKQPCECHKNFIMMDDNVNLNASSVFQSTENILENSPDSVKLNTREISTPQGIMLGAWVPEQIDQLQWVQATFQNTKLIYGIVTLGNNGVQPGMVTSYKVKYTTTNDEMTFVKDKNNNIVEFMGNLNADVKATNIFEQAVYTKVIRILPTKWRNTIALKFDVIGCNDRHNLALGRPTNLGSSTTLGKPIVDGFSHSSFSWSSCGISQQLDNPWFSVELKMMYLIEEVKIYTRQECCDGQLSQFSVRVGVSNMTTGPYSSDDECSFTPGVVEPGSILSVKCQAKPGRFIIIQKKTGTDKLALCEVQVYGQESPVQNIALNKPAEQISNYSKTSYHASKAVDGDMRLRGYKYSMTSMIKEPWWRVDLLEKSIIYSVAVTRRGDCCDERFKFDLHILVENEPSKPGQIRPSELCNSVPKNNYIKKGETRSIQCKSPVEGRFVKILLMTPKGYLTLVEVQVLGRKAFPQVYGGNATAEKCVLPFIYNGTSHEDCITTKDRPRLWCATTANYDKDFVWGYCMDVKLSGGRRVNEGRVQVRDPIKDWGTVCDDDWDVSEANVVCKRLGYQAGGRAVFPPFFGQGKGSIILGNLKCNGSEASLFECQHEKYPTECGHHEDAAVICTETDTTSFVGYPNDKRSQQDSTQEGVFIMQSTQEVKVPGKITAWKFYSVKKGSVLKLQVWRRVYDLEGLRYMLIGQVIATDALPEDGPVTITSPVAINVESGDLLGFSFKNGNPISYDNTFHCKKHGKVKFSRNANVTLGSIHSFAQKDDDDQKNCRMYSFFVEVETQRRSHLQEFTLNNKLYRIFTSKQKKASVEHLCKINMGDTASLFQMKTNSEFQYTKQKLGEVGVTGTFLTSNTVEQALFVTSWAPCQPEEGKECVVISNENKDQEYFWYTRSCADQYYYICAKNVTANGENPNVKSTPPASKTTAKPNQHHAVPGSKAEIYGENNKHLALSIVLPIFFLILIVAAVGIGLLYLRQRRTGKQIQDLLPAFMTRKRPSEIVYPLSPDDDSDYYEHSGITTNPQTGTVEVDLKALGDDNQNNVNKEFQKLGNI